MKLILHTGAHYTEQDRLIKTILRNTEKLSQKGVHVPGPGTYRSLMRDTLNAMHRAPASPDAREVLLDVMLDDAKADRVVLSDPNFFRTAGTALREGVIYPDAPERMMHMAHLFPDDDLEIFLAIRNPAGLVPILFDVAVHRQHGQFWGARQPQDLRWSETIANIRRAAPEIPLNVWCNEDMPLLWSQIIREMVGLDENEKIAGGFDLLSSIMSKEGMQRFRAYLNNHQEMSELQKRRVIAVFLDKFALEDEIEEELDMLGWTEELVDEMTAIYDEDLAVIQSIPGVRLITP